MHPKISVQVHDVAWRNCSRTVWSYDFFGVRLCTFQMFFQDLEIGFNDNGSPCLPSLVDHHGGLCALSGQPEHISCIKANAMYCGAILHST
jgi:hypothetical protein